MGWATLSASANRVAFDRLGSVPVVAGAATGRGFLALNSEIILGGEAVMIDFLLTVPTATFGSLGYGDTLTVDGTAYKVESQPLRFDDGTFCRVPLMKIDGDQPTIFILDGGAAPTPTTPAGTEIDYVYDGGGA